MTAPYTGSHAAHEKPDSDDISDETLMEFMNEEVFAKGVSLSFRVADDGTVGLYKGRDSVSLCIARGATVRECLVKHLLDH